MLLGVIPVLLDVLDLAADADAVDFAVGGQDAHRDRDVVPAAGAVDDVFEQKSLALRFRDAAAELPAHERMHLGVFVDRPLHADQQPLPLERSDMRMQVRIPRVFHFFTDCAWRVGDG